MSRGSTGTRLTSAPSIRFSTQEDDFSTQLWPASAPSTAPSFSTQLRHLATAPGFGTQLRHPSFITQLRHLQRAPSIGSPASAPSFGTQLRCLSFSTQLRHPCMFDSILRACTFFDFANCQLVCYCLSFAWCDFRLQYLLITWCDCSRGEMKLSQK